MKGIYIALIIALAVLTFSFDASAQGTPNGVGNGTPNGQPNGMNNGVGNGTSASSDIVMKGSKIGSNVYYVGSANGGVWKTTNGGHTGRTVNIRLVETERETDRKSASYLYRIATPATQEVEVHAKPKPKRSKP